MIPVLTPEEMAALDTTAPVPVDVLIERAGAAVAHHALEVLGGAYGRRVIVLAGKGNNGSDGRSAAGRLRRRGVRVEVVDAVGAPPCLPPADLVVDAAYGTGFRGDFEAPNPGVATVLAVDIPSGVDGVTGQERGHALAATRTVTFAALKPGLLLEPGRRLAGEVHIADIGLRVPSADLNVVEGADIAPWIPDRARDAHKWRSGIVVIAGSPGMSGAAHLAAAAAQRAGAGMVRVGSPGLADDPLRPTEAVGLVLPATGWAPRVLADLDRFHALVIGPGLGTEEETQTAVREVLSRSNVPAVVDGDALTALGTEARDRLRGRAEATVLTPHDGEHERLTGHRPGADRIAHARALATETGATVLLKGPTTVVATPGPRAAIVTGDARLATAGTGDVLSGVIGALLARGVAPFEAAAAGAWLHARAAALGPSAGLVAGDLPDLVARALAEARC